LDFDLILGKKIDEEKIFEKINRILSKYWTVKNQYNKRNTIFSMLSYWKIDKNIKLEISKRWISWNFEQKNWFWTSILVMTKKSIFTNKLFALLNRKDLANRDIYDIRFFLKKWTEIDEKLLEEKTWKKNSEYFNEIINFLENLPKSHSILDWLWEVLDNEKKNFVKKNLIQNLIDELKFYLMNN